MSNDSHLAVLHALAVSDNIRQAYIIQLHPEQFGDHSQVFEIIRGLHSEGRKISLPLIETMTRNRGLPTEWLGGPFSFYSTDEVASLADELIATYRKSQALVALNTAIQRIKDGADPAEAAETAFAALAMHGNDSGEVNPANMFDMVVGAVESRRGQENRGKLIFTHLKFLNDLTGGIGGGFLGQITSRTGVGKSSLALDFAVNIGIRQNQPVTVVNTEMSNLDIGQRIAANVTEAPEITLGAIGRGLTDAQAAMCRQQLEIIKNRCALRIVTVPDLSPEKLRAEIHRAATMHHAKLIVVDYFGRFDSLSLRKDRHEVLQIAAMACKQAALRYDIAILILAQLTDSGDIAGSRAVEREVDLHLRLLELPDAVEMKVINPAIIEGWKKRWPDTFHKINLIAQVKKGRNVKRGAFPLQFCGSKMKFFDEFSGFEATSTAPGDFGGEEVGFREWDSGGD